MADVVSFSEAPPVQVIAGRYRIERRLGRGGMGSVWRAEHLVLHSPVAIKVINSALAASEEARARFLREAQAAAQLRSPHVVQILDHGIEGGTPYIVMELLEGESLSDRLLRLGTLPPAQVARVLTQVARAMSRAHAAGIVHRDLKPENVFLVQNDDEEIAKVLDFGIAKADSALSEATTGTRTGAVMGTPHYMSPEQVEGSKLVDHRTDLWALAVMAFECLTGKRPFDGPTLGGVLVQICAKPIPVPSQVGQVPPAFDAWFARATARDPAARFQSAKELAEALRTAIDPDGHAGVKPDHSVAFKLSLIEQPIVPSESAAPRATVSSIPGVRRRPWGLMIAVAMVAIAALSFWALRADQQQPQAHVVTPAPARTGAAQPAEALPPAAAAQGSLSTAEEVSARVLPPTAAAVPEQVPLQPVAAAQIPSGAAAPTAEPAAEAATGDVPVRDAVENAAPPSAASASESASSARAGQRPAPTASVPASRTRTQHAVAKTTPPASSASEPPEPEPAKPSARKPDLGF